jgi:alpha-glucosidase
MGCNQKKQDVNDWTLTSPSGKLSIKVSLHNKSGALLYQVDSKFGDSSSTVILPSPLGIIREDQVFDSLLSYLGSDSIVKINSTYELKTGKRLKNVNKANHLTLHFKNRGGALIDLDLRAYDDGVAYRYRFPEESKEEKTITKELSGFKIPLGGKAWIQPYDTVTMWTPAYERYYLSEVEVGKQSPMSNGWCFPALFEVNNHFVLLTEADLTENYFGSHLNPDAQNGLYTIRSPEKEEALNTGENVARTALPFVGPWRVILVSPDLGGIVESNLVHHLTRPAEKDFSWVKPGRASWSWWGDHDSSKDFNKQKKFVDLAAEMGWEYALVDANWNVMKGGTIEDLAAYAKQKKVGLLLWYNSGGPHNEVAEQPRDIMWNADKRKAEMKRLSDLGVKGIKVDFFQTDKQHIIRQYFDILRDAADHQILVNFHGCTIPRGWSSSWPNLVSMESVKGAESYSFASDYPEEAPRLNTILPFTRNVIGPMDYTPVAFGNQTYPHKTTNAHELALAVVFESGIVHMADRAESYRSLDEEIKQFLRQVPAAWDETRFVQGYPGKDVVLARRKGTEWYIAGINGEAVSKEFSLALQFLDEGTYQAQLIMDGKKAGSFNSTRMSFKNSTSQIIGVNPFGGFVMILSKD